MISKKKLQEYLDEKFEYNNKTIRELSIRVSELERALEISGIIEQLNTHNIVSLHNNDPWAFSENMQYQVNRIKK